MMVLFLVVVCEGVVCFDCSVCDDLDLGGVRNENFFCETLLLFWLFLLLVLVARYFSWFLFFF